MIRNYRIASNLLVSSEEGDFDLLDASIVESSFILSQKVIDIKFLNYTGNLEINFKFIEVDLLEFLMDEQLNSDDLRLDQIGFHFKDLQSSNDSFNPDFDGFKESSILFWFREENYIKIGAKKSIVSVFNLNP